MLAFGTKKLVTPSTAVQAFQAVSSVAVVIVSFLMTFEALIMRQPRVCPLLHRPSCRLRKSPGWSVHRRIGMILVLSQERLALLELEAWSSRGRTRTVLQGGRAQVGSASFAVHSSSPQSCKDKTPTGRLAPPHTHTTQPPSR